MITTRITLDTKQWEKDLTALHTKQLPFARFLAVRNMGDAFQKAERDRLARVFTLRKPEFIFREAVKRIGPAASKHNPTVVFGVSDRVDFLKRFETGVTKAPTKGAGHLIAVPQQARRNAKDIITSGQRARPLVEVGKKRKGAGRVFVLREKRGRIGPGVFQTTGRKGKGGLKFMYGFEPNAPTAPSLQFLETAKQVAEQQWPRLFSAAFEEALRGAR